MSKKVVLKDFKQVKKKEKQRDKPVKVGYGQNFNSYSAKFIDMLQFKKASGEILILELGRVIFFKEIQSAKA